MSEQSTTQTADFELTAEREGAEWLEKYEAENGAFVIEGQGEALHAISDRAFDMILFFEISSKALYEARYRRPIWPGLSSGVTVGIGYDVGYANKVRLHGDWDGAIAPAMVLALEQAIGVKGQAAKPLAESLKSIVDVPWDAAILVHRHKVMPRWTALLDRSLPNVFELSADSAGALVSLIYNRGASFNRNGDRYREMRAIKMHMGGREFAKIPDEIRSMKRLWPHVGGLLKRRDAEADLFVDGLHGS